MTDHDTPRDDAPLDPTTEAALAALDRRGRRAAAALHTAVATLERPAAHPVLPLDVAGPAADGVVPVEVELRERSPGPRRRPRWERRVVLAAAAVAALGGLVASQLFLPSSAPDQVAGLGAPTAVLDDDGVGVYPPDATDRGITVASPEHTQVWDQWTLTVPPVGLHLVLDLQSEETMVTLVLPDAGASPLHALAFGSDTALPGTGETAVFGMVAAAGVEPSTVTVEQPGAAAVELHVEEIVGATHDAFVGFVPGDLDPDAQVVAVDAAGAEVARAPIAPAGTEDPADGLYPDDPQGPAQLFARDLSEQGVGWGGSVTTGGHYVVIGASGLEDSVSTVVERPGTQPLQALATLLGSGRSGQAEVVYGLVGADAARVELEVPGADAVELPLLPIDGATHQAFGARVDGGGDRPPGLDGAVVVARDAAGEEIARRPLSWTVHDVVG
jgi:hypothetical protein